MPGSHVAKTNLPSAPEDRFGERRAQVVSALTVIDGASGSKISQLNAAISGAKLKRSLATKATKFLPAIVLVKVSGVTCIAPSPSLFRATYSASQPFESGLKRAQLLKAV
jgi:hypothetical protein